MTTQKMYHRIVGMLLVLTLLVALCPAHAFAAAGDAVIASPGAGTYEYGQTILLSNGSVTDVIKYTEDGTEPSATNGTVYSGAITLTRSVTIKAAASTDGADPFGASSQNAYIVKPNIVTATPPSGSNFPTSGTVTLNCATPTAAIRYTTDLSEPSEANGTLYTGPISVTANTTIKAVSILIGTPTQLSAVQTFTYTQGTAGAVTFSPVSGTQVQGGSTVTLSPTVSGDQVRYLIGTGTPNATNTVPYTTPIIIDNDLTIQAVAVRGGVYGTPVSANYSINKVSPVKSSVSNYSNLAVGNTVTLNTPTAGAAIRYTTDGSTPSSTNGNTSASNTVSITITSGMVYSGVVNIKAYALKSPLANSDTVTYSYYVSNTVSNVTASPSSGSTVSLNQYVSLYCSTSGSTIRYTTDGSTPNSSSTVYTSSFQLTSGMFNSSNVATIKAYAISGSYSSSVTTFTYTLNTVLPVTASPSTSSSVQVGQTIVLSTGTYNATIYYTTDGTTPTTSSTRYTGSFAITAAMVNNGVVTIKAIAVRSGFSNSAVATFTYSTSQSTVASVTANPNSGTVAAGTSVILSCSTNGSTIRYTTNGSTPTSSSAIYSNGITINGSMTIKAFASASGMNDSAVQTFTYVVEKPSSWAVNEVNEAIELGFVPEDMQMKYSQGCTRAEFCEIAVLMYEDLTGEVIKKTATFTDTNDINVEKMAGLGIVTGVGNNKFSPTRSINRQEAALLLTNFMKVYGAKISTKATTFADKKSIASWALAAVGNLQANKIMNGTSPTRFSPLTSYTREQSMLSFLRMYKVITK